MANTSSVTGTGTGTGGHAAGLVKGTQFDQHAQRLLESAANYHGPSSYTVPTSSTTGDSNSSSSTNSSYTTTGDYASGQDAANAIGQALMDVEASEFAQLMTNPIAAIATGDKIRKLQAYIDAYRGGYQLPDQVVIPHARLASDRSSLTANSNSSGGSRTNTGTKDINNPDYDFAKEINRAVIGQHIQNRFSAD